MSLVEFYNENCFERFSKLEKGSVDVIVTDPP
jgi:DNA modification methylase